MAATAQGMGGQTCTKLPVKWWPRSSSLLTECGAAEVMFSLAWCPGSGSPRAQPCHCVVSFPRDDAFSDSLSQKADSEASSGPLLDDKASSKNDIQSPTDHIMDYGFGGVMGR